MLNALLKSVVDQDRSAVVICDLEHTIVYMNPAAVKNYEKYGGEALLGKNLLRCHGPQSVEAIYKVLDWFQEDSGHNMIFTHYSESKNRDVYMVALRDENGSLIGYYEKHEYRNKETAAPYDFTKSLV